jgi:glycosyltransferase involved in cell wall biosynthesis
MPVALVHERFTELGGSERVVEALHGIWPEAAIYTPILDRAALPSGLLDADIRTSRLQPLYRGGSRYAHLLPLLPLAMAHFDFSEATTVVTSHHAFANRIRVRPGTTVISYTHTPARWMWDGAMTANEVGGTFGRAALRAFTATQRAPDRRAAQRVDRLIVNSRHVARRVERWWGREAEVVHPPVDVDYFHPDPGVTREDFFLLAGRMVPYKRPELAVAAARAAGVRLVVVGDGRSRAAAEAAAGPGTEFLGAVDGDRLRDLFRRCRALVFPGEEDFGIVPVEAQACGAPVIGLRSGGVLETVIDGVTGVLYQPGQNEETALADAFRQFPDSQFEPGLIRKHAEAFSVGRFRAAMSRIVDGVSPDDATPHIVGDARA